MPQFVVEMDIVNDQGVSPYLIEVNAPTSFDAESEAHLIATHGEGLIVLRITSVEEVATT